MSRFYHGHEDEEDEFEPFEGEFAAMKVERTCQACSDKFRGMPDHGFCDSCADKRERGEDLYYD